MGKERGEERRDRTGGRSRKERSGGNEWGYRAISKLCFGEQSLNCCLPVLYVLLHDGLKRGRQRGEEGGKGGRVREGGMVREGGWGREGREGE